MAFRGKTDQEDREDQQASTEVAELDPQLLAMFAEMAVAIPAETAGGAEDILKALLSAKSWEDLNKPWETSDVEDIKGKRLRLVSAVRRPSRFKGGLRMFLVVKLLDPKDGKEYVKTTSSINVVGTLAWLYFRGAQAVTLEWFRAEEATESGFFPQHIKVWDCHIPTPGDGQ
jgi:hypothetical protein